MDAVDPNPEGWANEPAVKKKENTWIWVLVAFLVLCLCLVLVAGGVGAYLFVSRSENASQVTNLPMEVVPLPPTPPIAPTERPAPTEPAALPLPTELIIEPYIPGSEPVYGLREITPGYEGSSEPGAMTWDVSVGSTEPVVIQQGWCTLSEAILEENFLHIEITFEADGEVVDTDNMYLYDYASEDMFCRAYLGIIRAWPLGDHIIIINMSFDAPLNDGWGDYPAGEYIDQFIINVTR